MNPNLSDDRDDAERLRRYLSEVMDGEADGPAVDAACGAWRREASCRSAWHAYHLIGDVLRSDELGPGQTESAAFQRRLRERLQAEPVVLAPMPVRAAAPGRFRWAAPVALAASVVAAAGVVVVSRQAASGATGDAPALAFAASAPDLSAPVGVGNDGMLRDARVDDYLRAHRAMLVGSPAVLPGGAMRNVDLMVPAR